MRKCLVVIAAVLAACVLFSGAAFAAEPERVPSVIRDDFETGEMHAWEAYPYAQDIGYEPFTTCFREPAHNGSAFSLGNIRRAWDVTEVYQGFTKQIDLWTTGETRFKAAVFLTAERKPAWLELSLCLFDGSRYFHIIPAPEVNRWLELDIPAGEFAAAGKALGSGAHVQAVTIRAFYPLVYHLSSYTISLDDFILNGERQRRFVAVEPVSTTFEMFGYSILGRHFYYGDSFAISVRPDEAPGKYDFTSVTCSLVDPSGKTVVANAPLAASGGAWKAQGVHTFAASDPRGQWTVDFTGKDSFGHETRWGIRFIMPGNRLTPKEHPRIYFTAEELKKKLAADSPVKNMPEEFISGPDQFKNIDLSGINEPTDLTSAALTGGPFAKPQGDNWSGPMNRLGNIAETGALRYAFTGDEVAGKKAREALLKVCAFKSWNHPWQEARGNHTYYPVGYALGLVAVSYDHLYPLLSEADRKTVRDALMEKGVKPFYRDMVEMNRMPSSLTNHISVIVANLAVAAAAMYGDDPENPSLEPWLSGILGKMKLFMDRTYYPDGGYGEPIGYENMATRDLVEALYIIERTFGIDYTTTTNLKDLWRYPLHGAFSDSRMPGYGDTGKISGWGWTGLPFLWLSYRTQNPFTAYYTQPYMDQGRGGLWKFLWYTKGLPVKSREELVPSHHFPVKGTMFLRSGWSDDGSIMVFKSGPNSNHYHIDQGSLILLTNGEVLLSEASLEAFKGYHAYYANPFYPFYTTQAVGHNVMLVDGDPESQLQADYRNGIAALQDWPRITHSFAGWKADEVEGDLTCVYKGKLEKYTRSLMFVKPDIYFLYDRVKSPEGHSFQWLFHTEDTDGKSSITQEGARVRIERPKARMVMDILSSDVTSRVRLAERDERFLQVSSAKGLREAEFLAVMVPSAKKEAGAAEIKVVSSPICVSGWTGARVETGGKVVRAFFRTGAPGAAMVEGISTDAERFTIEGDAGGAVRSFFMRGSELRSGDISLKSGKPVSVSASFASDGVELEADTASDTDMTVGMAKAPASVTLNGAPVKTFKYDRKTKTVRFALPAGHTVVKVK